MRSKSVSIRIPQILLDAGTELAQEEYKSLNELMVGLLRYALAIHRPHTVTAAIAKLPRAEQDKIDDEIVRMFRSGSARKGQWFAHRVEEAVANVAGGRDLPDDRLARELLKVITSPSKEGA
jgi:hypothetical protein